MTEINVHLFIKGPTGRFLTLNLIESDTAQLAAPRFALDQNPAGGLRIYEDAEMILVDDSLPDVADFFLYTLPALLRRGEGAAYQFRTGPETTEVSIEGDIALITGYNGTELRLPAEELATALEAAVAQYEAIARLLPA